MKMHGLSFSFENKKWWAKMESPKLQTFVGVGTTKEKAFQSLLKDIDIEIKSFGWCIAEIEKLRLKSKKIKIALSVQKVKILKEN